MNIKRHGIIAILIISLVATLCACGKSDNNNNSNTTQSSANQPKYTIGVCLGADNEYYRQILQGFTTAISDNFTDNNVTITTLTADNNSDDNTSDIICNRLIQDKTSLIFTAGENAMQSARNQTDSIPIVSTAVMDYQKALNISADTGWDKTTKTNVTGISSVPNISDVLSMMIEVTPNITSVGIIYCPNDYDSIYQNRTLEHFLDEAGIGYKEYEFYSPSISDSSAREIVEYACDESSVLFIPAESSLKEKMGLIGTVATKRGIPTVGGDEYIGEDTLCCMYQDPFNQGYIAGEMAYDILATNKKPGTMTIASISEESEQKLYVASIAEKLAYTFPKSFRERSEFLSNYVIGSKTKRDNQATK